MTVAAVAAVPWLGHLALARSEAAARRLDWQESAAAARAASRVLPWSPEPELRLALAHLGRGDEGTARRAVRAAIAKDRTDPRLWRLLADLSSGDERVRALERAERLDPLGAP